ncbi:hypothetical protein AcW1_009309 [Taiwanofungus camphoratus]|nr:hypothetical protein AcW1_009309 [Antrodia cinnamomea]
MREAREAPAATTRAGFSLGSTPLPALRRPRGSRAARPSTLRRCTGLSSSVAALTTDDVKEPRCAVLRGRMKRQTARAIDAPACVQNGERAPWASLQAPYARARTHAIERTDALRPSFSPPSPPFSPGASAESA